MSVGVPVCLTVGDCLRRCVYICEADTLCVSVCDHNGGASGVMVIVVGNGHGDTSSNPGWDWLHFT